MSDEKEQQNNTSLLNLVENLFKELGRPYLSYYIFHYPRVIPRLSNNIIAKLKQANTSKKLNKALNLHNKTYPNRTVIFWIKEIHETNKNILSDIFTTSILTKLLNPKTQGDEIKTLFRTLKDPVSSNNHKTP